ncbi:MAG: GTPase HflX [Bacteroidetes bacterium]|nr:GTPase HflX [Bacteroidota bacterium]
MIDTARRKESCVLVGLITPGQDEDRVKEYLDELEFLVDTAGGVTLKRFIQKVDFPNPRTCVGSGKLEEIRAYVKSENSDMVIFDDELSPSQIRNLERSLECKILDRSNLILDIFASRARTAHARTQVELAQYQYLLPRLTRMWTHLEKQQGGIGMKGPGEKEIETDRRIIRAKIALLKEKLEIIDKQMATQRKNRTGNVRVALVGYTNVGKSTLMNLLSKSDVFAENKLFATLDTTVRKVVIGDIPFLLSDTVGFIRKLPHMLIESFKSTLDEVREADIVLHVVDISHPDFEEQINIVKQTLLEIDVAEKPTIYIFNKIDAYTYVEKDPYDLAPVTPKNYDLEELKRSWMAKINTPSLFISATEKTNLEALRNLLQNEVVQILRHRYPYEKFDN